MTYDIVMADAPHKYNQRANTGRMRGGALGHYNTMGDEWLDSVGASLLPLLAPSCLLYYWTTGPKFDRSIQTINSWGFEFKTAFGLVWAKTNKGKGSSFVRLNETHERIARNTDIKLKKHLQPDPEYAKAGFFFGNGFYTKANAEIAVLAKRGTGMKPVRDDVSSLIISPIRAHSQKPWEAHYRIEAMYPKAKKLELFARRRTPGWTCLGNELDGMDINESLTNLHSVHSAEGDWEEWLENRINPS